MGKFVMNVITSGAEDAVAEAFREFVGKCKSAGATVEHATAARTNEEALASGHIEDLAPSNS